MPYTTHIFLSDLKVQTLIGVHPEERLHKQPLIVSIQAATENVTDDNIASALNYDHLSQRILAICEASTFFLLESLAKDLIDKAVACHANVLEATVTLQKPEALKATKDVGCILTYTRE